MSLAAGFLNHEIQIKPLNWKLTPFQITVNLLAALPLFLVLYDYSADLVNWLGGGAAWAQVILPYLPLKFNINPIQDLTLRTGEAALILLVASLACSPIANLLRFKQAIRVRKDLGLWSFYYALLHFLIYTVLDYGLNLNLIWLELSQKLYVIVGFVAFLILMPLAITSTKGMQKRLGRTWKRLHYFVYLAALLAVAHFIWVVKSDIREPAIYGLIVAVLLALRLPTVKGWINALRIRFSGKKPTQQQTA